MGDNFNLLELLKQNIDFNKIIIDYGAGSTYDFPYEIKPREFLRFAKSDLKENNLKGYVNSVTNSKRAIDCQVDSVLSVMGIDPSTIDFASSGKDLIDMIDVVSNEEGLNYKYILLHALGIIPNLIISQVRGFRNKLEHHYKAPNYQLAKDHLELSELFINSIENQVSTLFDGFTIGNEWGENSLKKGIHFEFDFDNKKFILFQFQSEKVNKWEALVTYSSKDPIYFFLLKILINDHDYDKEDLLSSIQQFLKFVKHPIPEKHVKFLES